MQQNEPRLQLLSCYYSAEKLVQITLTLSPFVLLIYTH